jgi:hypothetical protein
MLGGYRGRRRLPRGGLRLVVEEPERAADPRLRGQMCDQPPGGRLGEIPYRLQVGGALQRQRSAGERIVRRGVVVVRSTGFSLFRLRLSHRVRQAKACTPNVCMPNLRRACAPFDEPARPQRRDAARLAQVQSRRGMIRPVNPTRMRGNQPLFHIPQQRPGDAPNDRPDGARRIQPPRVRQVGHFHLPIDDVTAAGPEGTQRQPQRGVGDSFAGLARVRETPSRFLVHRPGLAGAGSARRGQERWCGRRCHAFLSMPAASQ